MFRSRKLSFHLPKDRLSRGKSPCFATRNIYVSQTEDPIWECKSQEIGREKPFSDLVAYNFSSKIGVFDLTFERFIHTHKAVLASIAIGLFLHR